MKQATYESRMESLQQLADSIQEKITQKIAATPSEEVTGQAFKQYSGILKDLRDIRLLQQPEEGPGQLRIVLEAGPEEWNE